MYLLLRTHKRHYTYTDENNTYSSPSGLTMREVATVDFVHGYSHLNPSG